MAKYRLLNDEELNELQDDFVKYLVVNGITADQWESIKQEDAVKAREIVDLFSDVVFEKIMRTTEFLEYRTGGVIQAVQCNSDKMILVAIKRKTDTLDLREVDLASIKWEDVDLIKGEKAYVKSREEDLFEMTQQGYEISDGGLFKHLILHSVE